MSMPGIETVLYTGAIGLTVIGLAGLLMVKNVFRMLLALVILEAGASLLLILSGFRETGVAPIILSGLSGNTPGQLMNDPVPQALVLTAIVIGVGVQALALALILRVKYQYNTLDMVKIREQLEHDIASNAGVASPASAQSPDSLALARSGSIESAALATGDKHNG